MDAIYASKLYKNSSRQKAIRAAMQNPINKELVQQLSEYLDEPVKKKPIDKGISNQRTQTPLKQQSPNNTKNDTAKSPKPSMKGQPSQGFDNPDIPNDDQMPDMPDTDESVEESSCVSYKRTVKSFEQVPNFSVADILGLLRAKDTTAQVDRATIKDCKELWLFYNNSVNLNDIMNEVIDTINAAGYSHLEFNRLARSDNAIVFEITPITLCMKPNTSEPSEISGITNE